MGKSLCALLFIVSFPAHAVIIYQFDFTDLTGVTGGSGADFRLALTFPDYVTTIAMAPIPGPPIPTTLGYPVRFAGTNLVGMWGFDDDTNSEITDVGFGFGGESFLFVPSVTPDGFFTAPGIFAGMVQGNAPFSFEGDALLTITDTLAVSEPGVLWLLGIALISLRFMRRRPLYRD